MCEQCISVSLASHIDLLSVRTVYLSRSCIAHWPSECANSVPQYLLHRLLSNTATDCGDRFMINFHSQVVHDRKEAEFASRGQVPEPACCTWRHELIVQDFGEKQSAQIAGATQVTHCRLLLKHVSSSTLCKLSRSQHSTSSTSPRATILSSPPVLPALEPQC